MRETITISIAGIPIGFTVGNKRMGAAMRRRYHGYLYADSEPVITFDTRFTSGIIGTGEMPEIVSFQKDSGRIIRHDFDCSWHRHRGTLRVRSSIYSIDALLRVVLATIAVHHNTLFIHSAAVATDSYAVVFPGKSGSGKTTVSRLCTHRTVLNDEIVCVAVDSGNTVRVFGTPFWGEMGTGPVYAASYPVREIRFLRKSRRKTHSVSIPRADALNLLLQCCCIFVEDPAYTQEVLELAARIIESVPSVTFYFTRHSSIDI
jgi:hypothetical protein